MQVPPYTPAVKGLPSTVPFVGPEAQERQRGQLFVARMGANESPFGPWPLAVEAMTVASREAWKYSDPENHDLKQALARHHGALRRSSG
jgi:histidinol-phosphate aminotransferase